MDEQVGEEVDEHGDDDPYPQPESDTELEYESDDSVDDRSVKSFKEKIRQKLESAIHNVVVNERYSCPYHPKQAKDWPHPGPDEACARESPQRPLQEREGTTPGASGLSVLLCVWHVLMVVVSRSWMPSRQLY